MKKLVKFGSFALCLTLCAVMLTACGGKKDNLEFKTADVSFSAYDSSYALDATGIVNSSLKNGVHVVNVAAGTSEVEINLYNYFNKNKTTKAMLGEGFRFTRTDVLNKTGYGLEIVENGDGATATWKKYGAADTTAAVKSTYSDILRMYDFTSVDQDRIVLYADAATTSNLKSGNTYDITYNITGNNGKTAALKVQVNVAPEVIGLDDVGFYYFANEDASTAITLGSEASEEATNGVITVTVPATTFCVEVDIAATGIIGEGFSFTRSDISGTGYAYALVGEGQVDNADNLWRELGTTGDGVTKSEIDGPMLFIMDINNLTRMSFYLGSTTANVEGTYTFTFNGANGIVYTLAINVVVDAPAAE